MCKGMLAPSILVPQMGKLRLREPRSQGFLPLHVQVLESEAQRCLEQETQRMEDQPGHRAGVTPTHSLPFGFCSRPMESGTSGSRGFRPASS